MAQRGWLGSGRGLAVGPMPPAQYRPQAAADNENFLLTFPAAAAIAIGNLPGVAVAAALPGRGRGGWQPGEGGAALNWA